ncbi:MAG: 30S ribosomal protein S2 [Acidilobaceae archaeon]|nr:30S ribosomal protein S2 [Acidilobaceae archaeon]MCX8165811.1 30S ribosomal protein S2 [Acidilobaceae archaeon]MDW7974235.1 30S ribosomal protein S2 [Sulfolobales archaeon]
MSTLVPVDMYKKMGVIVGTQICTKYMKRFVYKIIQEGYYIFDVAKVDERLRIASRFLSTFEPEKIAVVSVRVYGQKPASMMCKYVGCKPILGRFVPGTFTNPRLEYYMEPDVVLLTDPRTDKQALLEAFKAGIPVVSFVDTDNKVEMIDLVIPANNRGRKSLALLYWILTREILRYRNILAQDQDLDVGPEAFMSLKVAEEEA